MYTIKFETKEQLSAVLRKLHNDGYRWSNGDSLVKPSRYNDAGDLSEYLHVGGGNTVVWRTRKNEWDNRLARDLVGEGEPHAVIKRLAVRDVNIPLPSNLSVDDVRRAVANLLDVEASKVTITYDEPI